jgi:hypothetical protein
MSNNDWKIVAIEKAVSQEDLNNILIDTPPEYGGLRNTNVFYINGKFDRVEEEFKVLPTTARYNYPKYKEICYKLKSSIENFMGEKLYPTYYFDRFYFSGSSLHKHIDRPACEISVSLQISNTTGVDWPLNFLSGEETLGYVMRPGDAILYKGMEFLHWRDKLECPKDAYFHQAFFHYVRADGYYLQYANDILPTPNK